MKYIRALAVVGLILSATLFQHRAIAAGTLDDATILAIFDQANWADIYAGRLGAKYGHSAEVRDLGRMVASEHIAVQQMGRDLAAKLAIIPSPPDLDTSAADLAKTALLLQSKSGSEFDRVYLQHEIAFHQAVIDAVKGRLLPAATNSELRSLLEKVLVGFTHHLAETKAVAKKLGVE